jgi:hypothetical protein
MYKGGGCGKQQRSVQATGIRATSDLERPHPAPDPCTKSKP